MKKNELFQQLTQDIRCVIFDLDGTLIDSMWVWGQIDIDYLESRELSLPSDYRACIEGMTFEEVAVYTKDRFGLTDDIPVIMAEWNDMAYDHYAHDVLLKEYVKDMLEDLHKSGIRMGIATSNSKMLVDAILDHHELHEYFQTICTSETVKKGKPEPDVYLAAAEKLDVDPAHCLVFEDVIMGIRAAKSAGMRVCAVYDEHSAHDDEKKRELADAFIRSYRDLYE